MHTDTENTPPVENVRLGVVREAPKRAAFSPLTKKDLAHRSTSSSSSDNVPSQHVEAGPSKAEYQALLDINAQLKKELEDLRATQLYSSLRDQPHRIRKIQTLHNEVQTLRSTVHKLQDDNSHLVAENRYLKKKMATPAPAPQPRAPVHSHHHHPAPSRSAIPVISDEDLYPPGEC
eukprot:TRINITY_DN2954_c0_g1_i2.p1 TRINITY_DN2954_c0_g1~~TRINITY_DN2954_c0_g1_i2.p1  ORF type:complete len:176 (-),score=40.33 TRINITY_DN2954_c0_g1_i2:113-640(-)